MRAPSWIPVAALAIAVFPAVAQTPAQPGKADEGFFKPSHDIALGSVPQPQALPAPAPAAAQPVAPVVEALVAEARAREAVERDLDRAQQEHARAQADAARQPQPMIVSPLDGTAPIVSPLGR